MPITTLWVKTSSLVTFYTHSDTHSQHLMLSLYSDKLDITYFHIVYSIMDYGLDHVFWHKIKNEIFNSLSIFYLGSSKTLFVWKSMVHDPVLNIYILFTSWRKSSEINQFLLSLTSMLHVAKNAYRKKCSRVIALYLKLETKKYTNHYKSELTETMLPVN